MTIFNDEDDDNNRIRNRRVVFIPTQTLLFYRLFKKTDGKRDRPTNQ